MCRQSQTPEFVPDQKCYDCSITNDLWMCMICGNIGCSRYSQAHAKQYGVKIYGKQNLSDVQHLRHFEKTSHIFSLKMGEKLVWDYAEDNYVHRLIQGI